MRDMVSGQQNDDSIFVGMGSMVSLFGGQKVLI